MKDIIEKAAAKVYSEAFGGLTWWTDPWDGKQKVMERHQHGPRAVEPLPPGITSDAAGHWSFSPSAQDRVAADQEAKALEALRHKRDEGEAEVPKAVPVAPLKAGDKVFWKAYPEFKYEVVQDQVGTHVVLRALTHIPGVNDLYNEPADRVEVLP